MYFRPPRLLLVILTLFSCQSCTESVDFVLSDGKSYKITDLNGVYTVFNFWAEWCKPCLEEIPEFNALAKTQISPGLFVVGISFDKLENSELISLKNKYKLSYPLILTDPNPRLPVPLPSALPATFIRTPAGEILGPLMGKQSKESILKFIEEQS